MSLIDNIYFVNNRFIFKSPLVVTDFGYEQRLNAESYTYALFEPYVPLRQLVSGLSIHFDLYFSWVSLILYIPLFCSIYLFYCVSKTETDIQGQELFLALTAHCVMIMIFSKSAFVIWRILYRVSLAHYYVLYTSGLATMHFVIVVRLIYIHIYYFIRIFIVYWYVFVDVIVADNLNMLELFEYDHAIYGWFLNLNDGSRNDAAVGSCDKLDNFGISSMDPLSFVFVALTLLIFPLCLWSNFDILLQIDAIECAMYLCALFFLEFFILQAFCARSFILFYLFFEATLIPMIFLIGVWGPTPRKTKAIYYLVFYTLAGSILFLFAILVLLVEKGTCDILFLLYLPVESQKLQLFLWCGFALSFAVKMPIFPFHVWLPEAHVEAPTVGSVILAALLLKLGGYGFIRLLPLFSYAHFFFVPLMYTAGVVSILYASLVTLRQVDLKKIIAYSSIAHMNLGTIGLFTFNLQGLQGSIFLMLSHGLVSAALFFLIGSLYSRTATKSIDYYGGLVFKMPVFTSFFFVFSLANLAFPGTANFVGELLILLGAVDANVSIMVIAASGMLFSSLYSIWLFNRICFGAPKIKYISLNQDFRSLEIMYMLPLLLGTLLAGICPTPILECTSLYLMITLVLVQV